MAWVTPALIVAGIAAGAAGLAHDIQGFVSGKTPWDNPKEWTTGALKAGALGFAGGFAGGALGPALGAAFGSAGGTATGTGSGLAADTAAISSNVGTVAANAGAPTALDAATMIPQAASDILAGGAQQAPSTFANAITNVGQNAIQYAGRAVVGGATGALDDMQNPLRGALVGAAGAVASSGLTNVGQGTGILPKAPTANFQPIGNTGGYSPDTASIMPPQPGYTSSGFGPSMGTRAMNAAGQLGVKAGTMGVKQYVGDAMTPQPQGPQMGTYQSFGIKPYFEQEPYA